MTLSDPMHAERSMGRVVVLGSLCIVLAWLVVTRSGAASLAEKRPETALALEPSNAVALITLAERKMRAPERSKSTDPAPDEPTTSGTPARGFESLSRLAQSLLPAGAHKPAERPNIARDALETFRTLAPDPAQRGEATSYARRALAADPLNAVAMRMLGVSAYATGDDAQAGVLMRAAARRSLRESIAVYWLALDSFERGAFADSVRYSDTLIRQKPALVTPVTPLLALIAESPEGAPHLQELLATGPFWRVWFLGGLQGAITDARTPLALMLALKGSPAPPTDRELADYLNFLVGRNLHSLAYYTWLQFLPPEQLTGASTVFNGGFERDPSGTPFDWQISRGSGVTVDIVRQSAPANRALYIEFGQGRVQFPPIRQTVILAPGEYVLRGRLKGELAGRRGLRWFLACSQRLDVALVESEMFVGAAPEWSEFEKKFEVPAEDCPTQELRLELAARSASEQIVSGRAWYDDIQLVRQPGARNEAIPAEKPKPLSAE